MYRTVLSFRPQSRSCTMACWWPTLDVR